MPLISALVFCHLQSGSQALSFAIFNQAHRVCLAEVYTLITHTPSLSFNWELNLQSTEFATLNSASDMGTGHKTIPTGCNLFLSRIKACNRTRLLVFILPSIIAASCAELKVSQARLPSKAAASKPALIFYPN